MLHAGFSAYWALGGQWLLATVGHWAVGVTCGHVPWPRFWWAVSWAGGLLLVAYGAVNVVVNGAVLTRVIRAAGGYDVDAMIGHAWLWDPLFPVWGTALVLSLRYSRGSPAPAS